MILSGAMQLSCIIEHDDCGALLETHLMSSMKFQSLKFTEKKFLKSWDNLATKEKVMESEEEGYFLMIVMTSSCFFHQMMKIKMHQELQPSVLQLGMSSKLFPKLKMAGEKIFHVKFVILCLEFFELGFKQSPNFSFINQFKIKLKILS